MFPPITYHLIPTYIYLYTPTIYRLLLSYHLPSALSPNAGTLPKINGRDLGTVDIQRDLGMQVHVPSKR